jgi:hypothetical protein
MEPLLSSGQSLSSNSCDAAQGQTTLTNNNLSFVARNRPELYDDTEPLLSVRALTFLVSR